MSEILLNIFTVIGILVVVSIVAGVVLALVEDRDDD